MNDELVPIGMSLLADLQHLGNLHALEPCGNAIDHVIAILSLQNGAGQQGIDGTASIATHVTGLGLVPWIIALRFASQWPRVADEFQLPANGQTQIFNDDSIFIESGDGLY